MTNHLSRLANELQVEATRLNADETAEQASALRDAISVLEAIPCTHEPIVGLLYQMTGEGPPSCRHCGIPMKRIWVVDEEAQKAAEEAEPEVCGAEYDGAFGVQQCTLPAEHWADPTEADHSWERATEEDPDEDTRVGYDGYLIHMRPDQEATQLSDSNGGKLWWVGPPGANTTQLDDFPTAWEARAAGWRPVFELAGYKCRTCMGRNRSTVGLRCATCGRDYGLPGAEEEAANADLPNGFAAVTPAP